METLAFAVLVLGALLVVTAPALAQAPSEDAPYGTVVGKVQDADGAPLSLANVRLLAADDSSLVRGTLAKEDGRFVLERISPNRYILHVSLIGYHPYLSDVLPVTDAGPYDVGTVVLTLSAVQMEGLTVEARRTLYEQKGNRLVVNVATSVTAAGATALDILKRSPGVQVNEQSGAVSMLGKDGVRILIDGKPTYMPSDAVLAYLSGLSADAIERIELITSPPAGMEAEGNAGFIDIVLKQSRSAGLSGSVTASGGYGEGEVTNTSANASYRSGPVRLAGSYSFLWNGQIQRLTNQRWVPTEAALTATHTRSRRDRVQRNHNARLVLDVDLTDRTTVGAVVSGYDNRWSMDALNRLSVDVDEQPSMRTDSDNAEVNHWQHLMGNVHVRHRFGSGHTVTADVDHLRYHNDNPTVYHNTTTDLSTGVMHQDVFDSGKITPLRLLVGRVDYTVESTETWTITTGVKGAFSRLDNDPTFVSLVDRAWIGDAGAAERTALQEDVLAAYMATTYSVNDRHTVEAGLRFEHTDSELDAAAGGAIVDRRFGSLFPSLTYTLTLDDKTKGSASYTRRITRPSFSDMAPFLYFIDPLTFFTGNTALQSAILNSVKLDATYRSVFASLQYTWEDDSIMRFQSRIVPEANVQILSPVNHPGTRTLTALAAVPVSVTDWWSTQNDAMVLRTEIDTRTSDAATLFRQTSFRVNSTHNVTFPWQLSGEATGYYQSGMRFGTTLTKEDWGVNVAVQRKLWNGAGDLTLGVDNVFETGDWVFVSEGVNGATDSRAVLDFRHRTFTLSLSRRFGEGTSAKTRATASEDESRRVQ